jgi:GNAT superfamily N-acetyltransferase
MSTLVIRPALVTDVASIAEVRQGALTDQELRGFSAPGSGNYFSVEKLSEMWDGGNRLRDDSELFVAERAGRVLGFIVINLKQRDDNIDKVVVARDEQGKGVGRALVEFAEELAKSRGMTVLTTDTTENAAGVPWRAYGFWRKMGYEDTGKRLPSSYDFRVIPLVKKLC